MARAQNPTKRNPDGPKGTFLPANIMLIETQLVALDMNRFSMQFPAATVLPRGVASNNSSSDAEEAPPTHTRHPIGGNNTAVRASAEHVPEAHFAQRADRISLNVNAIRGADAVGVIADSYRLDYEIVQHQDVWIRGYWNSLHKAIVEFQ